MMQKIEDIHDLELELVKLEGSNSKTTGNNIKIDRNRSNSKEISHIAYRNEEVINEIRKILKGTYKYYIYGTFC